MLSVTMCTFLDLDPEYASKARGCSDCAFGSVDGSIYISTPVDPLFVLLPILEKGRQPVNPVSFSQFCLRRIAFALTSLNGFSSH